MELHSFQKQKLHEFGPYGEILTKKEPSDTCLDLPQDYVYFAIW